MKRELLIAFFILSMLFFPSASAMEYSNVKGFAFDVISYDDCIEIAIINSDYAERSIEFYLQETNANVSCSRGYKTPMSFVNATPTDITIWLIPEEPEPHEAYYMNGRWNWFSGGSLNQLPKWFKINLSMGAVGTLYSGEGTYGIDVKDGSSDFINTSFISIGIGNFRGEGGSGHIASMYYQGNYTSMFGWERWGVQAEVGWVQTFKTTGTCDWIEQGKVRARMNCEDSDNYNFYFIPNDMRMFYTAHFSKYNDWNIFSSKTQVAGQTPDPIIFMGDGSPFGTAVAFGDQTATEGWRGLTVQDSWLGYVWNLNGTMGDFSIVDDGAGFVDYFGYTGADNFRIDPNTWLYQYVVIPNGTDNFNQSYLRNMWNSSFYADNVTVENNTGIVEMAHYNALMLRLNGTHNNLTVDVNITNDWHSLAPAIDGRQIFQTHNSTWLTFAIYNKSNHTNITAADLWHNYTCNVSAGRWQYGANDPQFAEYINISQGGNETQFCNNTNTCNDTVTCGEPVYAVWLMNASKQYRIRYGLGLPPLPPAVPTEYVPPIDYCLLLWAETNAEKLANDNWCVDNRTLARNITFQINVNRNITNITSYSEEECQYSCDNVTKACAPNPFNLSWAVALAIIVVLILIGLAKVLWR